MLSQILKKQLFKIKKKAVPFFLDETCLLALGALLSKQQSLMTSKKINDYEFKIFSQFGDDGIIQFLINHIKIDNNIFIEFGVDTYQQSNTRFLLMNNNWTGFVMDGSIGSMSSLKKQKWFWEYNLTCKAAFIDSENINYLLAETAFENIGLLHIDLDGNDYHILEAIDFTQLNPSILILEYNSVFGSERYISVPYNKNFVRTKAHYSNLYFGASLQALTFLAKKKGYVLIGSNLAGNNAFYIRNDLMNSNIIEKSVEESYVNSKFRESRDKNNSLTFLSGQERYNLIKGLDIYNVVTGEIEVL